MELYFTCTSCRKRIQVAGSAMGTRIPCPGCGIPLTVPRNDLAPGTRIAGFEIVRPLGKGGMGEVYLARQLSMGREVALKILSGEFAAREGAVERFMKEVHVAAKLEHPNIVTAHDAGQDEGLYYMAMNFVPGLSLAATLQPGVVLAERDALAMTRKLAQALDYAWGRFHIIHRDIKPANILFGADGEPKLADMGLSKSLDDAEAMTLSGSVMGTPNYMSPEQAKGAADLDFRADIYSLGATLYHAVTGQMPFAGSSIMAVLRKQAVENLPDPREFNPLLSEQLVGLLQIMLAKNRDDRYADWKTLLQDIDFVIESKPPSVALPAEGKSVLIRKGQGAPKKIVVPKQGLHPSPPPAAPPAQPKPPQQPRSKALVIAVAAALAVTALGTILTVSRSKHAEQQRLQAQRDAQQSAEAREREAQAGKSREQAELWQVAADFAAANTDAYDRAVANFEDAGKRLAGTKYELMAKNEIARIRDARGAAVRKTLAELEARALEPAGRKDFEAAAEIFSKYQGVFAADLASERTAREQKYRTLAAEAVAKLTQAERAAKEAERAARDAERAVIAAAADAVYAGDLAKAQQACRAFADDPAVTIDKAEVKRVGGWLEQVAAADRTLLATFAAQKDKTIPLVLDGAKTEVRIAGVRGDRIQVERKKGMGSVTVELPLAQIAMDEQYARLKDKLDPAALGLWAGALMLKAKRPDLAAKQFQSTGPLATALLAKTEGAKSGQREADAQAALAQVLQSLRLPATALQPDAIASNLQPGKITVAQATAALRQLDAYAAAFGDTQHAQASAPVIAVLQPTLEAARKGVSPSALVTAPTAKPDDFTQRILAARACTGEVIRCSPDGGNGLLGYEEALKRLKPGMILRLASGRYPSNFIKTDRIVVESEPKARIDSELFLRGSDCVVRNLSCFRIDFSPTEKGGRLTVIDSNLMLITHESRVEFFNCKIGGSSLMGGTEAILRHCTLWGFSFDLMMQADRSTKCIEIEDCLAVASGKHLVEIQLKTDDYVYIRIDIARSLIFCPKWVTLYDRSQEQKSPLPATMAARILRMTGCVTNEPDLLNPTTLAPGSPGKGIAAGGRDPGALFDDKGNILPLDPVPPVASSSIANPPVRSGAAPIQREPRLGETATVDLGNGVKLDLVWIPPGEFLMGSPADEMERTDQETRHRVTLTEGFWMGKYEVTQRQYLQVTGENPSGLKAAGQEVPVERVDWNQAKSFCEKLEAVPGFASLRRGVGNQALRARLPTEAEWEYACRAGSTGPHAGALNEMAWYGLNSGGMTHPVGQLRPNAWGLYDMHGNVSEWCGDWFSPAYFESGAVTNPTGVLSHPLSLRMIRGGHYSTAAGRCRSADRYRNSPGTRNESVGFRVVISSAASSLVAERFLLQPTRPVAPTAPQSSSAAAQPERAGVGARGAPPGSRVPAKEQVQRCVDELKRLNPGYDGQEKHRIVGNEVVEFEFLPPTMTEVTNLAPLRALAGLKTVICGGYKFDGKPVRSRLSHLDSLRGLPLTELRVMFSQVCDLSPLAGMPLKKLNVYQNDMLSDLTPLKGMSLEWLGVAITAVGDLSPLAGMPLKTLLCYTTPVSDLSPLRGMPLEDLDCHGTSVASLAPLANMKLRVLRIYSTGVSDITPLRGMPLELLACHSTRVNALSPIRDMPFLRDLTCDFTPGRDTDIIRSVHTLRKINDLPVADFWKRVAEGESPKAP